MGCVLAEGHHICLTVDARIGVVTIIKPPLPFVVLLIGRIEIWYEALLVSASWQ